MSYTTPLTAVSNATLTAAQWNASVRDDLLETAPAKATTAGGIFVATGANSIAQRLVGSDFVAATETTTNTGYVNLTTTGPQITITAGTSVITMFGAHMWNDTAGGRSLMSLGFSSANTIAAGDALSYAHDISSAGRIIGATRVIMQSGLTPGSNVITAKYRVASGTGTWSQRALIVIPL
jgi:hypothetical protein